MAEKINWNYVVQALHGPSVSGAGKLDVEAYEKIEIQILAGSTHEVSISNTSNISLLIIGSTTPDPAITYAGTPALPIGECKLDAPHIFIGEIAKDFLEADTVLTFTNGTGKDTEIQVLIGRKTA
jgi:hypothetical protein